MKTILISPWSRNTPDGKKCAKNYPFWQKLIDLLKIKGFKVISVGVDGEDILRTDHHYKNLPLEQVKNLLLECDTWISVDNFFHHFASFYNKKGIVIFSKSDPLIFGNPENINLLKSRSYLRKNQFHFWNNEPLDKESFVSPEVVINSVIQLVG